MIIPKLYIIIRCCNEEEALKIVPKQFLEVLTKLIKNKEISSQSRILFVDDGSTDDTWNIIKDLSKTSEYVEGIKQSRNRGHQNALLAGLMEVKDNCDITITIDCDGQDDIATIETMVTEYKNGADIVYGVRKTRDTDSFFKKHTAERYYKILKFLGADIVYNHADFRLISSKVLNELAEYKEVNLFLRGMIPLVGFKSTNVLYERTERVAGQTHYTLKKMVDFAIEGITSLTIQPLKLIMTMGLLFSTMTFIGLVVSIILYCIGYITNRWDVFLFICCFLGSIQMLSVGIIGEYIGKIYMEVKHRPRYIISERTKK